MAHIIGIILGIILVAGIFGSIIMALCEWADQEPESDEVKQERWFNRGRTIARWFK